MQNIIFDKYTFFDNKLEFLSLKMIAEINSFIIRIRLSEAQTTNKHLLKEDKKILKSLFNLENDKKSNTKEVIIFNKKKDYKLVRVLENILLILSLSEVDVKITFHIQLLIRMNDQY